MNRLSNKGFIGSVYKIYVNNGLVSNDDLYMHILKIDILIFGTLDMFNIIIPQLLGASFHAAYCLFKHVEETMGTD